MKKSFVFSIIVVCLIPLVSCTSSNETTGQNLPVALPTATVDPYEELWPRIDGSTATIPLSEGIIVSRLHMAPEKAAGYVVHNTTANAYDNLLNEKADLIFVTYPSKNELRMAREWQIPLEVVPIAKDGLVFMVNTQNKVNSLELSDIINIYMNQKKNWKEFGGEDIPIKPFQRSKDSGSQTLFLKLVMGKQKPAKAPSVLVQSEMSGLVDRIASYDNAKSAIGYSFYYYVSNMYNKDAIKLLSVNGVMPSYDTFLSGEYPLTTHYYAVIRKDTPKDHPARKLIEWLLTDEGQRVVQQSGYVPVRAVP